MREGRIFAADYRLPAGFSRGATLIDVVVGSALMILVFTGFVGAFKLAVDAVSNNKARAGAIALTNERLEYIRSLAYDSIGTVGGIPSGAMAQSETITLNDVTYTRRTFVSYEDDPGDGSGAADTNSVPADYKAAKVSVTWYYKTAPRTLTMVTRISPPNGVETAVPGGTLSFQVVNALSQPISNAQVRVLNSGVSPAVDLTTFTDAAGAASVIGAPAGAGYQITVSKSGYSSAQTYSASSTNTNPTPAHLGVVLNQTTTASFAIDLVGSAMVQTLVPIATATSTESLTTQNAVASSDNVTVAGGEARLTGSGSYTSPGTLVSTSISTSTLVQWKSFSWVSSKPAGTNISFQFLDTSGALIPDAQISGNSGGLFVSPVNLSAVSTSSYPAFVVRVTLTTSDASNTPSLDSWSVVSDSGPLPLLNIPFTMRGAKTIGSGPGGPVYKFDQNFSSGSLGSIAIPNVEYDSYTLSVDPASNYAISSSCAPQPIAIGAAQSVTTQLFLAPLTVNSLLVDVRSAGGAVIPGATVRLYRSGYDTTLASDQCGQAFFSGISSGSVGSGNPYSIDVAASGFQPYTSSQVNVSGTTRLSVILN